MIDSVDETRMCSYETGPLRATCAPGKQCRAYVVDPIRWSGCWLPTGEGAGHFKVPLRQK